MSHNNALRNYPGVPSTPRPPPNKDASKGAIHSTKISGNFGPKLNGTVWSNQKSFEKQVHLLGLTQPPPQALRFSHGRGERETRVTGDEPQGTMGRVQTAGEVKAKPVVSFPPSFARTFSSKERRLGTRQGLTTFPGWTGWNFG